MWKYHYKDHPNDLDAQKSRVEAGKGIIGCEMHEVFGWQDSHYLEEKRKLGLLRKMLLFFKGTLAFSKNEHDKS
jgi:hypothetical protein